MAVQQGQNRPSSLSEKRGRQTVNFKWCTHIGCDCTLFDYKLQAIGIGGATLLFPKVREVSLNYYQFVFWQQLAECVMPMEAGGLVEMIHIACGGFLRNRMGDVGTLSLNAQ